MVLSRNILKVEWRADPLPSPTKTSSPNVSTSAISQNYTLVFATIFMLLVFFWKLLFWSSFFLSLKLLSYLGHLWCSLFNCMHIPSSTYFANGAFGKGPSGFQALLFRTVKNQEQFSIFEESQNMG